MTPTKTACCICLLIVMICTSGFYQQETGTCAEQLKQLREALEKHHMIYNRFPDTLAELRLKNLVTSLDAFLCEGEPGSIQRIEEIEEKSDFVYRPDLPPYSGSPVLLAHRAGDQFTLALYENGTIQALTSGSDEDATREEQTAEDSALPDGETEDGEEERSLEASPTTDSSEDNAGNLANVFIVILVLIFLVGGVFLVRSLVVSSAGEYRTKVPKEQFPTHQMKTLPDGDAPEIELRSSSGQSKVFPLKRFPVFIGRAADNHISIREESVSRRHARIDLEGNTLIISDMESTNGMFVNGKRVKSQRLTQDMTVEIGTNRLQLVPNNSMKKQM